MKPQRMIVNRDVPASEDGNFAGRDVARGDILWTFHLPTYGCIDDVRGIAMSRQPGEYPFFEFPRNAVSIA